MAKMDFSGIIAEIVQPEVQEEVVVAGMDKLYSIGTRNDNIKSGSSITDTDCVAETAAGGAFTRADANPESMTTTFVEPSWTKKYYQEAIKVRREDIDESLAGSVVANTQIIKYATAKAVKQLMKHAFTGCMTQIKADIDSAATYSTGAITRVTNLQSYEEATDTAITLAILRTAQSAIALKDEVDWNDYIWLLEQTVLNTAHPLMVATGSWVENNPRPGVGRPVGEGGMATGYNAVATFDQIRIETMYGMTVGDCYLYRPEDLQIQMHKGLEIEPVEVDEYAYKFVARIGVNAWVRHPKMQGKLTSKD